MQHLIQELVVALLVPGCGAYAAWRLLPGSAQRSVTVGLLKLPHLPGRLGAALRALAAPASGGCGGCENAPAVSALRAAGCGLRAEQPITLHPRRRG